MPQEVKRRFIHVKALTHGAVNHSTIQSVSIDKSYQEISDSGDDDGADTFLAKGKLSVTVSVELRDPVQADALVDRAASTLTFKGVPETGGTEVTVTVLGVIFFRHGNRAVHNGVATQTVSGRAYKPDGTDPVTVALAT
jgi:hypothetical protein